MQAQNIELAKPFPKQIRFADWEVGAFLCFDVITYSGEEHGDGITAQPYIYIFHEYRIRKQNIE